MIGGGIFRRGHSEKFAAISDKVRLVEIEGIQGSDPAHGRVEHKLSQAAHETLSPQQHLGREAEMPAAQAFHGALVQAA